MERERAANDCSSLLTLIDRIEERWLMSSDDVVRTLARDLAQVVDALATLEQKLLGGGERAVPVRRRH